MDYNVTQKSARALENAADIEKIVKNITDAMDELDNIVKKTTSEGIQVDWGDELKSGWKVYHENNIPQTMIEMKHSAENIHKTVEEMLKFSGTSGSF